MNPYYEETGITIYRADYREIAASLPVADVVMADPPYGITSLPWDTWPTGWVDCITASSLWVFGTMRMFMEHCDEFAAAKWKLSQDVVWEKHNGSSFHADRFRRTHESAALFYRGDWHDVYHDPQVTMDATKRTVRRKERPSHMGEIEGTTHVSFDGGPRLQKSVFHVRSCHGVAQNETQKPLGIVRPLLSYSCPPKGLVHSPFMGSGTDLVVAKELGLRAVGCDVREEQCEVAANRLRQEVMNFDGE